MVVEGEQEHTEGLGYKQEHNPVGVDPDPDKQLGVEVGTVEGVVDRQQAEGSVDRPVEGEHHKEKEKTEDGKHRQVVVVVEDENHKRQQG